MATSSYDHRHESAPVDRSAVFAGLSAAGAVALAGITVAHAERALNPIPVPRECLSSGNEPWVIERLGCDATGRQSTDIGIVAGGSLGVALLTVAAIRSVRRVVARGR